MLLDNEAMKSPFSSARRQLAARSICGALFRVAKVC